MTPIPSSSPANRRRLLHQDIHLCLVWELLPRLHLQSFRQASRATLAWLRHRSRLKLHPLRRHLRCLRQHHRQHHHCQILPPNLDALLCNHQAKADRPSLLCRRLENTRRNPARPLDSPGRQACRSNRMQLRQHRPFALPHRLQALLNRNASVPVHKDSRRQDQRRPSGRKRKRSAPRRKPREHNQWVFPLREVLA